LVYRVSDPTLGITCKTKKTLHSEKTEYQELAVIETEQFGRMLLLDGIIQTTVADEFVYHEMIAHVPLFTHKNPKKALVVGGGDGGSIREIVKHPSIEKAVLCEIDRRVIEGLGTIEIVIIIAVLIAIALIFRKAIINFVKSITDSIFGDDVKGQV